MNLHRGTPSSKVWYTRRHYLPAVWAISVVVLVGFSAYQGGLDPSRLASTSTSRSSAGLSSDVIPYPPCVTQEVQGVPSCAYAQLVYDATDGYVVAYMICAHTYITFAACTWKFSQGGWTNVTATHGPNPPPVLEDGFVWDAADGYAVLFGGEIYFSGAPLQSVWVFHNGVWSNLTSSSPPAIPHTFVRAVYDSTARYVLSVWQNGYLPDGNTYTWAFRSGTWTNLTSSANGSGLPVNPSVADDPSDGGAILFGGLNISARTLSDQTWLFSGGAWELLRPHVSPSTRSVPSLSYDSLAGYDLLVGGVGPTCLSSRCPILTDEWRFEDRQWTNITSTLLGDPPVEAAGPMTTDIADGYVLEGFGWSAFPLNSTAPIQSDLYAYANGTWTAFAPPSPGFSLLDAILTVAGVAAVAAVAALFIVRRRRTG